MTTPHASPPRALYIAAAVIGAVALVGLLLGTQREPYQTNALGAHPAQRPDASTGQAEPARAYRDLLTNPWDKNLALRDNAVRLGAEQLAQATPPAQPASEADRLDTLARRLRRRAYDGAPPAVPHPIEQQGDQACISCHNVGLRVKDRVARPMSHEYLTNCVQCHAAVTTPQPFPEADPDALPLDNTFQGRASRDGVRATPGAPPAIPHQTWMRERCASCHGAQGWEGIRTTHPERANCLQCHAPSAIDDQQPALPQLGPP